MNIQQPKEFLRIKVIFVGEGGAGKTSIAKRFGENKFDSNYNPTIAVDYQNKIIETKANNFNVKKLVLFMDITVQINIWDFSGHPEFYEVRNEFYKDAHAIFFIFDLTLKRSLDGLDMWYKEASELGAKDAIYYLIGNKTDQSRMINESEARKWAQTKQMNYFEVSAASGEGIKEVFLNLIKQVGE